MSSTSNEIAAVNNTENETKEDSHGTVAAETGAGEAAVADDCGIAKEDSHSTVAAETCAGEAAVTDDAGITILSEEQTDAALAALQEATSLAIVKDGDDKHDGGTAAENEDQEENKKRKADENDNDVGSKPPAKRRSTPVRVSWDDRMEMLKAYKAEHGDLLIPIRYKRNPSLGKFTHNMREQYKLFHHRTKVGYKKKCSLTAERIKQLEDIGFVFSTERTKRQNEDWEARFQQLKEYKEKHGNCLVPHGYKEDESFAEWIHRQRTTYASHQKSKKQNPLVEERMKKLETIGFVFTVHSDKWMDHWLQLKAFKQKHKHCQVPTHYAENPKLGRWVHTQRHQRRLQLKGKKSCMTQERIDLLDQLEFSWEVRPSLELPRASWSQRLEELTQFFETHHHFCVPQAHYPQLHAWCTEQKQRLKQVDKSGKDSSKRMGPDRIKLLHELGFTKDVELAPPEGLDHAEDDKPESDTDQQEKKDSEEHAGSASMEAADMAAEKTDVAQV